MRWPTIFVLASVVLVLVACALHRPPPCNGGAYPDPCVASSPDASGD